MWARNRHVDWRMSVSLSFIRRFWLAGDAVGVGGDGGEFGDELFGADGGDLSPNGFGGTVIVRLDLAEQFKAGRSKNDVEGAAVGRVVGAADEAAGFEAVNEAGDVGAVHDEAAAEFDLTQAIGVVLKEVEDVELAGAKVPAGEEDAAGVPKVFGGAQEFDEGLVTRPWGG
jgi:hypothetical protein